MVRLKPPKWPKPEPPPGGLVIFVRTENGFDIESGGKTKRRGKKKKRKEKT